jgi:uncharacterized protein YbgA (DUF1722 family)
MSGLYPYIYIDYANSIWKFTRKKNDELCYNIMYGEGKWTKESLIDTDVRDFAVHIDMDEAIHIVYSNTRGELKYCTMKNKQWLGKILYKVEIDDFEIQDLKIEIIGDEMHIFFMIIANDGSDHGILMHCRWNGKEPKIENIQDIILVPDSEEYYFTETRNKSSIDLFFITDEGDEVSLMYSSFYKNRWNLSKRLYGIKGDKISFSVLSNEQEFHILNKSREDTTYLLDYVCLDMSGNTQEFRVYENNIEPMDPLLFSENSNLFACWLDKSRINYSVFDGEDWSIPNFYEGIVDTSLQKYNFIFHNNKNEVEIKGIYGTNEPDLNLIFQDKISIVSKVNVEYEVKKINENVIKEDNELQIVTLELARVKSEKKTLEKKIASYNMQLQKKQRFVEDYEEKIAKILEQKRKIEENCNVYLEVQKKIQSELEKTKQQLLDESARTVEIHNKFNEKQEEIEQFRIQITKVTDENKNFKMRIDMLLEENEVLKDNLKNTEENKKLLQKQIENMRVDNKLLNEQFEDLKVENKRLYEELQFEKNQSIMNRLLRRRTSDL